MRASTWPMRSSSSKVRTMKVTSGDALCIFAVDYLHTDRSKATGIRAYRSIPQTRRHRRPIVKRRARATSTRHRCAQLGVVAQSRERGAEIVEARDRFVEQLGQAA